MLDTPLPGVASVEALPVSFFALESFWMPEDLETLSGAKGWRMGTGSTSYCDNIARKVSSVICGRLSKHMIRRFGFVSVGRGIAHIPNIAAVLGDKISHFHLFDCLGKLQHLRAVVAAQRHDKLVDVMRHLLAARFNCAEYRVRRQRGGSNAACCAPSTSSSSSQHLNLEDPCERSGITMRFTGEWGFTYIRGIGYAGSLWLDHGLQLL